MPQLNVSFHKKSVIVMERKTISKKDSVKTQASTIESCAYPNSEVESHSDLQEELKTLFDSSKDSAENEEQEISKCSINKFL